jgi:hypothetical protein
MLHYWLKFDNGNGARIFEQSKYIAHGTSKFDLNSLLHYIFKLRVALIYK